MRKSALDTRVYTFVKMKVSFIRLGKNILFPHMCAGVVGSCIRNSECSGKLRGFAKLWERNEIFNIRE